MIWIALLLTILFILFAVPIGAALGIVTTGYLLLNGIPLEIVPQRMLGGLHNALLVAIPLFMIAARLMNRIGATERIFDLAAAIIGHIRGGLGYVVVTTSIIFSAMSGSATADVVGVGTITIREMRRHGYPAEFASAITLASATLAPIIPPSIMFIVYSVTAGVSIGRLFLAGVLPGLFIAAGLMIAVAILSARRGYPVAGQFSFRTTWRALRRAFFPLLTPVILLGGIFGGIFTPTEAAVVALDYILILGLFYKSISFKAFYNEMVQAGTLIGAIMFIISVSGMNAWMFTMEQLPVFVLESVTQLTEDPELITLLIIFVALLLGMFIDAIPIVLILVPVLLPLLEVVQIEPVHFGLLFVVTTVIGLITPPVGMCLYGISGVSGLSIESIFKATLPFFVALLLAITALVFMEDFVLFLPDLVYGTEIS